MRLIPAMTALACACGPAWATDYFVRVGGSNGSSGTSAQQAWATVAYAAQQARAGDTVYVGAGEYAGQVYLADKGASAANPLRFIADTQGEHTGDAGGVTIRSGGSALHLIRAGGVEMTGFVITNAGTGSTLVFSDTSPDVVLDSCELIAGGTAVQGQNQYSFTIRGCTISSQNSHCLYLPGGSAEVTDTTVTGVGPQHAAVYPFNGASVTLDRCSLLDGFDIVYTTGSTLRITNTVLANARRNAIYQTNQTTLTLVGCTVAGAAADGIYAVGGTQTIRNTIFSGIGDDVLVRINGSDMTVSDCLFHDYGDQMGENYTVGSPIEGDPLFVNASANDYSLRVGSPAIDAGGDVSAYTVVDRAGLARPGGAGWDIGAYESDGSAGVVAAAVPYEAGFSTLGAEWLGARTTGLSIGGSCLGKMGLSGGSDESVSLHLATTPGTEYQLVYTLILFDGWDFSGQYGDAFRVRVDGVTVSEPALSPSLFDLRANIGGASAADRVYRAFSLRFTASGSETVISFQGENTGDVSEEGWGLDDIRVMPVGLAYASTPYENDFEGSVGNEWTASRVDDQVDALGTFLGRFGVDNEHAALLGVETTPGETYTLRFDIFFIDSWDSGEEVRVSIGGTEAVSLFLGNGYERPPAAIYAGSAADEVGPVGFWASYQDTLFRAVTLRFTASSARTDIVFRGTSNQAASDESWGIDNVSVRQGERRRVVRWREISSVDAE